MSDKPEYCKCGKCYLRTDWGEPRDGATVAGILHSPQGCPPQGRVMEWVKRRIFIFNQERPNYQEVEHVLFFRLRSDGIAYYQVSQMSNADMIHRIPGGWIYDLFEGYRKETNPKVPHMTEKEFDETFDKNMKRVGGIEVEEF